MELSKIRQTKLKNLVNSAGLGEFADRVGRSKTQISNLTTGWRNMGEKLAREFEQKLALEPGYFDKPEAGVVITNIKNLDSRPVPLITWESLLSEDSGTSGEVLMASKITPSNAFAITVIDKSMEPVFTTGDTLIIDPNKPPKPSSYVIAIADNEGILRKYRVVSKDTYELVPLNSDYPTLSSETSNIEIRGVVIQLRKSFE